eukprot:3515860-Alexandrium_andersonii.AAC.1
MRAHLQACEREDVQLVVFGPRPCSTSQLCFTRLLCASRSESCPRVGLVDSESTGWGLSWVVRNARTCTHPFTRVH